MSTRTFGGHTYTDCWECGLPLGRAGASHVCSRKHTIEWLCDLRMLEHAAEIATALDTFEYAAERSSMNNIGATAKDHAKWLRSLVGGPAETTS